MDVIGDCERIDTIALPAAITLWNCEYGGFDLCPVRTIFLTRSETR